MKIAILGCKGIPASYGGFETFAHELATGLVKKGVEVTVFCEKGDSDMETFEGVSLVYQNVPKAGPLSTIVYDARCLWDARSEYDVVYMLGYGTSIFCFLPRLFGTSVWINMDGIEWKRRKWGFFGRAYLRIMERIALWTSNRIIADAEEIKTFLTSRYQDIPKCSVIPYGAHIVDQAPDMSGLQNWGIEPFKYHLVVCRLEPENHVVEVVKGFLNSRSPYPLVVLGNINADSGYAKLLRTYSDDRIKFAGTVFDQHKLRILRFYCNAYLHGHSVGGTNPSLLEALACGNLIIAHDNPFNREVIGKNGIFFNTHEQITEQIELIESFSSEQRKQISFQARQTIASRYRWEDVINKYHELLNESMTAVVKYPA